MSLSSAVVLAFRARSMPSTVSLANLLSRLPEELILDVLGYVLSLPGCIAKPEFWTGLCEWPTCHCQSGTWHHVPAKQLTSETLTPLLRAPEPIPRLAQLAFYSCNTFHFCGPQNDRVWAGSSVWLPPTGIRHWIRRLEVEVEVALPLSNPHFDSKEGPIHCPAPARDWEFLRRLQRGVLGFTGLRTLKLMFEALFITKDEPLRILDDLLSRIEPFYFRAQSLVLEACSAYPLWLDDDCMTGDIILDERLQEVLQKHMSLCIEKQSSKD